MINLNRFANIAAIFAIALFALTAKANAQEALVSGGGTTVGKNVMCSMETYVSSGRATGSVTFQFPYASAVYQGSAFAISPVAIDSKGTKTITVSTVGSLTPAKGTAVRCLATFTLVQAPGSRGSFTATFNQYVMGQTIAANMAAPGPAVQTGLGVIAMQLGGVTILQ